MLTNNQTPHIHQYTSFTRPLLALCVGLSFGFGSSLSLAQQLQTESIENPIYIADSPIASESLQRLTELLAQNNFNEAARVIDHIITEFGNRLISVGNSDVSIPVRDHAHAYLLDHPRLLQTYRTNITPIAQTWLDQGNWHKAWNDAWLTAPGFIASLHHAQTLIENAHFQAGARMLQSLEAHPDASLFADQASTVSLIAAKYLDTSNAWAAADQWAKRANKNTPAHTPIHLPHPSHAPLSSLIWNTNQKINQISLTGIIPGILSQVPLTPASQLDQVQDPNQPRRLSGANWDPTSWISPVVSGNRLYTNDGITISCFDRFTLRPIWRKQTAKDITELPIDSDARARLGRVIEDTTTLTIVANDLYIPTGIPRNGSRVGDARLLKVDALTGKTKWAVDINALDPTLTQASIRGQVIVDQDTVIIGARTNNRKKRLISFAVVGLDAQTGSLKWLRHIASAGSLPFQQTGQLAHSPTLHKGVIYWTDYIGLGFAIESSTGQVLWATPLPAPDLYARSVRPSFSSNTPIVTDQGVFVLTTDGTKIIQLDKATGQQIASRPANPVGEALYLLQVDDLIACVSKYKVTFIPINRFEHAASTRTSLLGDNAGIRGRVIVVANQFLIPIHSGVLMLDPHHPGTTNQIELDATGNIIALEGQIIVVDETNISSFLAWDTASTLLTQRIEHDPSAAITLAELAYRAEQSTQTLPAVAQAIDVITALPINQRPELNNELFSVILDMVEPAHQSTQSSPLDSAAQKALLKHLSTLAQSHQQVIAHRMALGDWNEKRGLAAEAVRAYQDILDQPSLSSSMWEGTGIAVRGGLEATRRIGNILNVSGYAPYKAFDQIATSERSFLNVSPKPSELEQLAKRFPWATTTPSLWLEVSQAQSKTRQISASISTANKGLDIAQDLSDLHIRIDQSTIDQLVEQAITGMLATNRPNDAQTLATKLEQVFPNLTLRIAGEIITNDQITQRAIAATRRPTLGNTFIRDDQPILLTGSPIKPTVRIDPGGIVMYSPQYGQIKYVRAGRNVFETFWSRKSPTNEPPIIPWQDETRTLILYPEGAQLDHTGTLEAIETTTGKPIWVIENIGAKLANQSTRIPDDLARKEHMFLSPVHGQVPVNQLIVVTDGHTVIVSDRVGRAIAIDLFSGKQLWQRDLPVNRLHDLDLNAGVLGICGLMYTNQLDQKQHNILNSIVASIDPRTGEPIGIIDHFGQLPRWIRVGNDSNLLVATNERIVAINTKEGSIDWVLNDDDLIESLAGWIVGDQLIVLDERANLWPITIAQGTRTTTPMDIKQRIEARSWVQVRADINSLIIAGNKGLVIFDHNQQLIADDSMNLQRPLIDLAQGTQRCVCIETPLFVDDSSTSQLYLIDLNDATLLDTTLLAVPAILNRQPVSITAITGGVIVGYTEVSIFVRTTSAKQ